MRKGGPVVHERRRMAQLSTGGNTPPATKTMQTGGPNKPSAFRGLAKAVGVRGVSLGGRNPPVVATPKTLRTGGPNPAVPGMKKLQTGGPNPASRTKTPIMSTNTPAARKKAKKRKPFGVL